MFSSKFNLSGFNQGATGGAVFMTAVLAGVGTLTADMTAVYLMAAGPLAGEGDIVWAFDPVELAGEGELVITGQVIKRWMAAGELAGVGALTAEMSSYGVQQIAISGVSFAPGDSIVINTEAMTVTKNGVSILEYVNAAADFFSLLAGSNAISYQDNGSSRTVVITVQKKDRWL